MSKQNIHIHLPPYGGFYLVKDLKTKEKKVVLVSCRKMSLMLCLLA